MWSLRQLHAASRGVRRGRPGTVGDGELAGNLAQDILEVHVHGPVLLSRDVRKIIGTTSSLRNDAARLEAMAKRLGVPLRWRLDTAYDSALRDDYINALNHARLDVAAWSSADNKDLITLQPARTAVQTDYHYAIHRDHVTRLRELIGQLDRERLEVVGLHVAAPTLMRNASRPVATVLTRKNPLQPVSLGLDLRSTYLPLERLEQLEQAGGEVVAYAQVPSSFAPTPQHLFVVQAASDSPYTHMMRSCAHNGVDNERAHWAEQGWRLCGQTSVDGKTYTLIFKRPVLKAPEPVADDSAEMTLRGESISTVPEPLRFTTDSGHVFDIDELVEFCHEKGALTNPFTNGPLASSDIDRLLQHPSQAGLVLVASLEAERAQQSHLSHATLVHIEQIAAALQAEAPGAGLPQSTRMLSTFEAYTSTLSTEERLALYASRFSLTDNLNRPFSMSVMQALVGIQTGAGCSLATARYLLAMVAAVRGAPQH